MSFHSFIHTNRVYLFEYVKKLLYSIDVTSNCGFKQSGYRL